MCATLTPRIRVDNGYSVYKYTGEILYTVVAKGELWDVSWRPMPGVF